MDDAYKILSESQAITTILNSPGKFVLHLGAGISQAAGIPLASEICEQIRAREEEALRSDGLQDEELERQLIARLKWDAPSEKYSQTVRVGLRSPDARIGYFRSLLKDKTPTFSHFAIALLMDRDLIRKTCLTTNFDKLVTSAFFGLGRTECQAIRTRDEVRYWVREKDKCYCLMLHGDCDTRSIRNTLTETGPLEDEWRDAVKQLLRDSGLVVLGSAGHEESVYNLIQEITSRDSLESGVLGHGLLWGVYVGDADDPTTAVRDAIRDSQVGAQILNVMNRERRRPMDFAFFPVSGSDAFFDHLLQRTKNPELVRTGRLHLDHEHRVRIALTGHGFAPEFVRLHVDKIASVRSRMQRTGGTSPLSTELVRVDENAGQALVVAYGDITNQALAEHPRLAPLRRAILSSDDTYYTAGGGVALSIVERAGSRAVLNELEKFQKPVEPGDVLVTSSGSFMTQYIFHAAIVGMRPDDGGRYEVDRSHVRAAIRRAVRQMHALDVRCIYVPLLGSGLGGISAQESLEDILGEIESADAAPPGSCFVVVVRNRADLALADLEAICGRVLQRFVTEDTQAWQFPPVEHDG